MATQDYLGEELDVSKGLAPEPEGGSWEDYAITSNIFGMDVYNPELIVRENMLKSEWNMDEKKAIFDTLSTPEDYALLNESINKAHYDNLKGRREVARQSEERIANDSTIMQFAGSAGMALLDPTIFVPGTLGFKGTKSLIALKRIGYGAAVGAGLSAGYEDMLSSITARESHAGSAALYGAMFGGGMFAIGPMISGGKAATQRAARAFVEPSPMEKMMNGEYDVKYNALDDTFNYIDEKGVKTTVNAGGVGLEPMPVDWEPPKMNKFVSKFVISPVSRLTKSEYPLFNKLGSMMQASPIFRKVGGKIHTEGENAFGIQQQLRIHHSTARRNMIIAHTDAQKSGYQGSYEQFEREISDMFDDYRYGTMEALHEDMYREMKRINDQMDISISNMRENSQYALNSKVKQLLKISKQKDGTTDLFQRQETIRKLKEAHQADLDRQVQEYRANADKHYITPNSGNYSTRFNELMMKANDEFDLNRVPQEYRAGLKAYLDFNNNYTAHMRKIKYKGADGLTPNLYKTRSWNLEKIAAHTPSQLRAIVREAYLNDPLNKTALRHGAMTIKAAEKNIDLIVEHMQDVTLIRNLPDNSLTVPSSMPLGKYMETAKFNMNDKYLGELIDRDFTTIMEQYNYQMSGRVALHTMFGTDDLNVLKNEVIKPAARQAESMGATKKDIERLADDFNTLFEQILGTHNMPEKPNAWGEKSTRMLMKLNYLTFGGGFGVNALADMGTVAFTVGLGNTMKHFAPALKAIRNLDKSHPDLPWIEQAMGLGAASDFYTARALSRFDDMDTMFTGSKAERILDRGGRVMQFASGLQHITAAEELMAIGGGTVDMVKTAIKFKKTGKLPRGFEEKIARYGLTKEDLLWVADQPVKIHKGKLYDFNWEEWTDKKKMEKFQTAITKTMNDAVIRGDKTLLPQYMTSRNPFVKLMTQFLRYPHIAHERILLRGASKPTARFLTGAMTSAALMASIYYIREQALIKAGLLEENDAKFAIYDRWGQFDDEAMERLSWTVLSKMPQWGIATDIFNKGMAATGQEAVGRMYKESPWTAIGGVGGSRAESVFKSMDNLFNGKGDGMFWYYQTKGWIPFQNLYNMDQLYTPVAKDIIEGR